MGDSIRVLHVDDEPEFADLTAQFLEREDERLDVVTETTAADGLARLADEEFDCVVSDYRMPGMDGLELLAAVREEFPDLPFVLFTGQGSEAVASDAITAGATDYLQKGSGPEQYELLANRVLNAVEQRRVTRRAAELDRIRTLASDINRVLVRAESREEVETRVCEIISDSDPYAFAWIGEVDPDADRVRPRAWAGIEAGYLEEITVDDSPTGQGPGGTALRERRVVVSGTVDEDPAFEPWRDQALERGYRAVAAVPLEYEGTVYGLLVVYSELADAFDGEERDLLVEIGANIAHTVHSLDVRDRLRTERDRRQALFGNAPGPVVAAEVGERIEITDVNDAFADVFGYDAEELIGTDPAEIILPADGMDRHERFRERAKAGETITTEVDRVTKDGPRTFLLHVIPFTEGDDQVAGMYAWYTDISEQESRVRELARRNERLAEFASVASHDLQNLLHAAEGYLDHCREHRDSEHLDRAASAVRRSSRLLEDLSALAREGPQTSEVETIDLSELCAECWQNVGSADATLRVETDRTIRGDPSRLKQLFENLLRNAIEHGGEDVTVTIGHLDDGFYVADDGAGIPDGRHEQVFDVGYSTAEAGTGFGLNVVREIVDGHDWTVRATDSADGGARFEITGVEFDQ